MGNQPSNNSEKQLETFPEKDKLFGFVNVKLIYLLNRITIFAM